MKTIKLALSVLILTLIMGFSSVSKLQSESKSTKKHIVLILKNPMGQEKFSIFEVKQIGELLIGKNKDSEDYFVQDGIYRIEGSSDDKLYHKRIIIVNE